MHHGLGGAYSTAERSGQTTISTFLVGNGCLDKLVLTGSDPLGRLPSLLVPEPGPEVPLTVGLEQKYQEHVVLGEEPKQKRLLELFPLLEGV